MGMVNFGIPIDHANWLKTKLNLNVAVEGGTYVGNTAKLLSKNYEKVYTIEKSKEMYEIAERNLCKINNVFLRLGDTRDYLKEITNKEDGVLFWLDAHWSGSATYGESDECPLIEELQIIFESRLQNYAILIDDARLFMAPPPLPHVEKAWPTIQDICAIIPNGYKLIIHDDVIFITPNIANFREYMQNVTTKAWNDLGRSNIRTRIRSILWWL